MTRRRVYLLHADPISLNRRMCTHIAALRTHYYTYVRLHTHRQTHKCGRVHYELIYLNIKVGRVICYAVRRDIPRWISQRVRSISLDK